MFAAVLALIQAMDLAPTDSYVTTYRRCVLAKSTEIAAHNSEPIAVVVSRATDQCASELAALETIMIQTLQNYMPPANAATLARQMRDTTRDSATEAAKSHLVQNAVRSE